MVLGQLYTVKHDSKKAEEEFKTAQAIEPESEDVVLNLARLYGESGDMPHAANNRFLARYAFLALPVEAFPDVEADVRQSLRRIENSPFVTKHVSLRGFVFDVATGKLHEVTL